MPHSIPSTSYDYIVVWKHAHDLQTFALRVDTRKSVKSPSNSRTHTSGIGKVSRCLSARTAFTNAKGENAVGEFNGWSRRGVSPVIGTCGGTGAVRLLAKLKSAIRTNRRHVFPELARHDFTLMPHMWLRPEFLRKLPDSDRLLELRFVLLHICSSVVEAD